MNVLRLHNSFTTCAKTQPSAWNRLYFGWLVVQNRGKMGSRTLGLLASWVVGACGASLGASAARSSWINLLAALILKASPPNLLLG